MRAATDQRGSHSRYSESNKEKNNLFQTSKSSGGKILIQDTSSLFTVSQNEISEQQIAKLDHDDKMHKTKSQRLIQQEFKPFKDRPSD